MPALFKMLASRGLDVDAADRRGNTALHVAAYAGRVDAVKAILALRPNLSLLNAEGKTPLECAGADSKARPLIKDALSREQARSATAGPSM